MSVVTVDDHVQALLSGVDAVTEIRDKSGKLLGFFAPMTEREAVAYLTAPSRFDPAELQRREEAEGHLRGRALHEVVAQLQATEKP